MQVRNSFIGLAALESKLDEHSVRPDLGPN